VREREHATHKVTEESLVREGDTTTLPHTFPQNLESVYSWSCILYNLHKLRKNTWLPFSELEKIQVKKLRKILKYAYENIAFYHQKFNKAKVRPGDIKSIEDLHKIPVLTKSEVQKNFKSLIAKGIEIQRCKISTTSGSTGIPLTVVAEEKASHILVANNLRH